MTRRQFFFIFIIGSKGLERKGGRMIAAEFDDRLSTQVENRPNDHKFYASCIGCAGGISVHVVSRGHPEALT